MAQRADAFRSGRFYLPTINLSDPTTSFGNITPAFNNNYDVSINFQKSSGLKNFIDKHGFYDQQNAGTYLALFCSEAVLPGSDIQFAQVDGLRQGISQKYATYRRFSDILLTYYSQTDYYTNDVFNAWMEYISPTSSRVQNPAYRRMKYPNTYKCDMEITAFSRDTNDDFSKLNTTSRFNVKLPSSITYKLKNIFPSNIVAAPLAYGRAELIKTTIRFQYDQYFVDRSSRRGAVLQESKDNDRLVPRVPSKKNVQADSVDDLFSNTEVIDGEEFKVYTGEGTFNNDQEIDFEANGLYQY